MMLYAKLDILLCAFAFIHRSLASCGNNPEWQDTLSAWNEAGTDIQLPLWWQNQSSEQHDSFANELAKNFGSHPTGFECGVGDFSSCVAQGCADYELNGDPIWAYLALQATVNLDTLFNSIFTGISNGQQDYDDLIGVLAENFFPWNKPKFPLKNAALWVVAAITTLFSIPTVIGEGVGLASVGIGAVLGASVSQISQALEPVSTELEGLATLAALSDQVSESSRKSLETWANTTMLGEKDAANRTIIDYLRGGAYITGNIPNSNEIEIFYKKQMVSRTVNAQWIKQKVFVTFMKTDNPRDDSGPAESRYYSEADGGVYYLYRYIEDGPLRGHLDKPWGLEKLNGSQYDIKPSDITKSSARAWRHAGFNYTSGIAQERLEESVSSNGTLTPFADGPGWEGVWTLPVCDIGDNNWNTQYGDKKSRYGMLPCCCGENCHDTKAFVNATYLGGFQTLLRGCKAQLRDTDLDFSSIDYGFGWKTSFALAYAVMSRAQKAGTIIGFILLGLLGGAVLTITLLIVRLSCRRRIRYRPKESYEFASRFGYA